MIKKTCHAESAGQIEREEWEAPDKEKINPHFGVWPRFVRDVSAVRAWKLIFTLLP